MEGYQSLIGWKLLFNKNPIRRRKNMGIFSSKKATNTEPKKSKAQIYLEERGITDLSQKSHRQVNKIAIDLAGNGLAKAGLALTFAKVEEQAKVGYLSALVEQNWILIEQNQQIINELKKLNEGKTE